MDTFSALLALGAGNLYRSLTNFPHKGEWRGAMIFSLICAWINGWVNNRETGDLRCHRVHYDVNAMQIRRASSGQAQRVLATRRGLLAACNQGASRRPLRPVYSLHWRQNGRDGVSNHHPHDCLLNRLFRLRSKKTSKLRVTGLCAGNSPLTGEFPAQMDSNEENASIWLRYHVTWIKGNLRWDKYLHPLKMWEEITSAFPNCNVAHPLKFGKGLEISTHTLLCMWLLIHAGVKVNLC